MNLFVCLFAPVVVNKNAVLSKKSLSPYRSKKEGKDQESIQSRTTTDPGDQDHMSSYLSVNPYMHAFFMKGRVKVIET